MAKPKTLTNRLTECFGIVCPNQLIELDLLSVDVYNAIVHFNNSEKAVVDIMELPKIASGYYMTKCCRSVHMHRKCLSIYRMSETQRKRRKVLRYSKKKQQDKSIETEGTLCQKGSF